MTSTPVPRTSAMRTWPRRTGASGRSLAISARMGKSISRGTGRLSRTETILAARAPDGHGRGQVALRDGGPPRRRRGRPYRIDFLGLGSPRPRPSRPRARSRPGRGRRSGGRAGRAHSWQPTSRSSSTAARTLIFWSSDGSRRANFFLRVDLACRLSLDHDLDVPERPRDPEAPFDAGTSRASRSGAGRT